MTAMDYMYVVWEERWLSLILIDTYYSSGTWQQLENFVIRNICIHPSRNIIFVSFQIWKKQER